MRTLAYAFRPPLPNCCISLLEPLRCSAIEPLDLDYEMKFVIKSSHSNSSIMDAKTYALCFGSSPDLVEVVCTLRVLGFECVAGLQRWGFRCRN